MMHPIIIHDDRMSKRGLLTGASSPPEGSFTQRNRIGVGKLDAIGRSWKSLDPTDIDLLKVVGLNKIRA